MRRFFAITVAAVVLAVRGALYDVTSFPAADTTRFLISTAALLPVNETVLSGAVPLALPWHTIFFSTAYDAVYINPNVRLSLSCSPLLHPPFFKTCAHCTQGFVSFGKAVEDGVLGCDLQKFSATPTPVISAFGTRLSFNESASGNGVFYGLFDDCGAANLTGNASSGGGGSGSVALADALEFHGDRVCLVVRWVGLDEADNAT
jgi:hypothetical protein